MASGGFPRGGSQNSAETATLDSRNPVIDPQGQGPYRAGTSAGGTSAGDDNRTTWPRKGRADRRDGLDRFRDEQTLLWGAFAFAAGIAVYAGLPEEPSLIVLAAALALALAVFFYLARRQRFPDWGAVLLMAFLCGLTTGSLRTAMVDAPRIGEAMNVTLTGQVLERQAGSSGARLVISVATVNERSASELGFPARVRVRVPSASDGRVGETVRLRARLFPPMGPVFPGGYDFSFRAYFLGIGATGFSYGPANVIAAGRVSAALKASAAVAQLREGLAERIRSTLSDAPETALIVALLVGDRSGITEDQETVLRAAGLAHILAISGLHMALFAGGTYAAALLILALFAPLTLHWPIHKWAAVAALAAATVYLVLSGAAVATQRSFLMIAIVFLGIVVGRRGVTLRSVAIAALVLLVIAPERLFFPGFQMSFAAVICLVAVYDLWRRRERDLTGRTARPIGLKRVTAYARAWLAGLFVTALVAGLATGIIGAHHFGRVAPYGLIGNMLGMPVFSLLVMPMGVLALVLMPLGLAALPLTLMAFGVSLLLKIAHFTAGLDAGSGVTGRLEGTAALLLLSALFAGLLLPGRARLGAIVPLVAGIAIAAGSRPPDIQIASSGGHVVARDEAGLLRFSSRRSSFSTELWFQLEGVSPDAIGSRKMKSPQRRCDALGCVVHAYSPADLEEETATSAAFLAIALPKVPEATETDCRYADILVSDQVVPQECRARLVLGPETRATRGAVSIWLAGNGPLAESQARESGSGMMQASTGAGMSDTAEPGSTGPDKNGLGTGPPITGPPIMGQPDTALEGTTIPIPGGAPVISRLVYAIPDPPRPWHLPGTVTRADLRRAARSGSQ